MSPIPSLSPQALAASHAAALSRPDVAARSEAAEQLLELAMRGTDLESVRDLLAAAFAGPDEQVRRIVGRALAIWTLLRTWARNHRPRT